MLMTESATPEIEDFRRQFRSWLRTADVPPLSYWVSVRTSGGEDIFDELRQWQRTLYASGWLGLDLPTEYGGRSLPTLYQSAIYEELVRARAPLPIGVVGLDVMAPTLVRHGSADQKAALLRPILSGDDIWCQGFSEPEAGSDLASLRTRGRVDGDQVTIDGQKIWTSFAKQATWCAVLARTGSFESRHRGISYVLVPLPSDGITIHPILQITGDNEFNALTFDNVKVPISNLVGGMSDGWSVAMDTLSHERSYHVLQRRVNVEVALTEIIGAIRDATPNARRYLERIGMYTRLGHLCSTVAVLDAQARQIVAYIDGDQQRKSGSESIDKLILSQTEQELFSLGEDLLGAYRQTPDARPLGLDAARWIHDYLYSRSMSVAGGTREIQRNIVATRVLGLPRS
jgi:alkylation response protein AidB-like acyl-CoA dehydrogenase